MIFLDALPLGATGKVQKMDLRRQYANVLCVGARETGLTTRSNTMNRIKGGCLCGSVRYETLAGAADERRSAIAVHCQKQSGSAFSTNVVVPAAGFEVAARRSPPSTTSAKAVSP